MKKMVSWFSEHKRVCAVMMAVMMISSLAVSASANGDAGGVSSDLSSFISSIKGALSDFTTTNLATILVAALSLTAGLAIAWFAYRFIRGKVSSALRRGKL